MITTGAHPPDSQMETALPAPITEYEDAIRWIYDRINYERIRPRTTSVHFSVERVEKLLKLIDSPQSRIPAVHIAGTKGKGSTAAILDSILRASGLHSGLFTSPHIHQFEERMQVCGQQPTRAELIELVVRLKGILAGAPPGFREDEVTYFEVATLLAWMFFDQKETELVVLETGLGGRLDTTNVCRPLVTIITVIGLDHTQILGDTIQQIATEKAGIIKPGVPVLTAATQNDAVRVITDRARHEGCQLWKTGREILVNVIDADSGPPQQRLSISTPVRQHDEIKLNLAGTYQADNAALAVATADLLSQTESRITPESVARGVSSTAWPMRFEIVRAKDPGRPTVVLDVAHNPDSVAAVAATIRAVFGGQHPAVLLFASSKDKDAREMLRLLGPLFDRFVLTEFQENPRARDRNKLAEWATEVLPEDTSGSAGEPRIATAANPAEGLNVAEMLASPDGMVCVLGSFFLAAEVRELLLQRGAL